MGAEPLRLPPRLDGEALPQVRRLILEHEGPELVLAGDEVERINGLGLQLLAAAALTRRGAGQGFAIAAPSPALSAALQRLPISFEPTDE